MKSLIQIASECIIKCLCFQIFSALQTSKDVVQITFECTIKHPCFQNLLSKSIFQNFDSNTIRMQQCVLVFKMFSAVLFLEKKLRGRTPNTRAVTYFAHTTPLVYKIPIIWSLINRSLKQTPILIYDLNHSTLQI